MEECFDNKRKKLFAVLLTIEIVNIVIEIVAGEFMNGLPRTFIRFIFLLVANYCLQMNFAIFYSVFTIFSALYMVDPVGLFLTGHGQKKTTLQNIFCILALLLSLVASYLGYLYAKQLAAQSLIAPSNNYDENYQSFSRPINRPVVPNNDQNNSYGGTNYFYQNPSNPSRPSNPEPPRSQFQPFTGQGYSLS